MKNINQISVNGETYNIGPIGRRVEFKYVSSRRIGEFLKTDPERVEIFMDDEGILYVVNKGDLDTYFYRHQDERPGVYEKIIRTEEVENEFLKGISFDLF